MFSIMAGPMPSTGPAGAIIRNCRCRCHSRRLPAPGCFPPIPKCGGISPKASSISVCAGACILRPHHLPARARLVRAGPCDPGCAAPTSSSTGTTPVIRASPNFSQHYPRTSARTSARSATAWQGLASHCNVLTGSDISEGHWDAFFDFYMDTGGRKWGRPYLTREFFSLIGEIHEQTHSAGHSPAAAAGQSPEP